MADFKRIDIPWTVIFSDNNASNGDFNAVTNWFPAADFDTLRCTFEVQNSTDSGGIIKPDFDDHQHQAAGSVGVLLSDLVGSHPVRARPVALGNQEELSSALLHERARTCRHAPACTGPHAPGNPFTFSFRTCIMPPSKRFLPPLSTLPEQTASEFTPLTPWIPAVGLSRFRLVREGGRVVASGQGARPVAMTTAKDGGEPC